MSVVLIKNNKGGVGKSLITYWLAKGLAELDKKVLILTSDNQNNILTYANFNKEYDDGLSSWMEHGNGELIKLSNNLSYIPLKEYKLKKNFEAKFKELINNLKKDYDYILIDGSPVIGIDNIFLEISNKIIIPTFLDEVSTQGILNLLDYIPLEKIKAVIPNRTMRTRIEKNFYLKLNDMLEQQDILLTEPIPQSAFILKLISSGKTIWDTHSKKAESFQEIFSQVLEVIING